MKTKNIAIILLTLLIGIVIGNWVNTSPSQIDEHLGHNHSEENVEEYTCSMHPQIRQPEFGKCPICAMDLVPVGTMGSSDPFVIEMSLEASRLAQVQTVVVKSGEIEKEILLQGEIELNEGNEKVLSARFPGRIEHLHVDYEGMLVEKDQVLAEIYSPELIAAQNEFLEALKYQDKQPALLEAAKNKLILWDISLDQIHTIESTGTIIQSVQITSPYKGIVQKKYVNTGSYISEGSALFQIVDLSSVWVVFDVYEEDITWVNIGDRVDFRINGFAHKEFHSNITFIDPVMQGKSRTVKVRLEVGNKEGLFKPSMFVKGVLRSVRHTRVDQVIVPKTAVLWTGKRSVVYLGDEDEDTNKYTYKEVIIASEFGENYLIEKGLSPGDRLVSMGVFKVDAAAQLSGKYSMMNPPRGRSLVSHIPTGFQEQLEKAFGHYLGMKNALVDSDLKKSMEYKNLLYNSLLSIKVSPLDKDLNEYWMNWSSDFENSIKKGLKEQELDEIRSEFSNISDLLIILTEDLSFHSETVFKTYCSMAFDNEGAFWLSEFEEIANPYYGESMLKCGAVKKVYK